MSDMDFETEQSVWERVNGREPEPLSALEMCCWESAQAFRQMAADAPAQMRETLRQLSKRAYANAMTIRGMRVMNGEDPEPIQEKLPQNKTGLRRGLSQCFRRSQQARGEYLSRQEEYSPIFRLLALEEEKIMQEILKLVGR